MKTLTIDCRTCFFYQQNIIQSWYLWSVYHEIFIFIDNLRTENYDVWVLARSSTGLGVAEATGRSSRAWPQISVTLIMASGDLQRPVVTSRQWWHPPPHRGHWGHWQPRTRSLGDTPIMIMMMIIMTSRMTIVSSSKELKWTLLG